MPRPPPHLARRGHGLALAPRPPRRGLPARPLRPDAAAGGESTQSLTLSLGNGCRKVPVAAISPSSRGVPGAVLRPATAPGELWGQPQSAQDSSPNPTAAARCPARPPTPRVGLSVAPHLRQPVHVARACGRQTQGDPAQAGPGPTYLSLSSTSPPTTTTTAATPNPSAQPTGGLEGGPEGVSVLVARCPHGSVTGPSPSAAQVTEPPGKLRAPPEAPTRSAGGGMGEGHSVRA